MRDASPPSRSDRTGAPADVSRDELISALPEFLASQEWTRSAYAAVASVFSDPEAAAMARRFEADVRAEIEDAHGALRRSGMDVAMPGGDPVDIEDEAQVFIGRIVLPTLRGAYADARYVTVLMGFEVAGQAASSVAHRVATRSGAAEWAEASARASARSEERLAYLRGRLDELAEVAFSGAPGLGYRAAPGERAEPRTYR